MVIVFWDSLDSFLKLFQDIYASTSMFQDKTSVLEVKILCCKNNMAVEKIIIIIFTLLVFFLITRRILCVTLLTCFFFVDSTRTHVIMVKFLAFPANSVSNRFVFVPQTSVGTWFCTDFSHMQMAFEVRILLTVFYPNLFLMWSSIHLIGDLPHHSLHYFHILIISLGD